MFLRAYPEFELDVYRAPDGGKDCTGNLFAWCWHS